MAEDKHFVAHPEGGVTTEAALAEAEKAKTEGAAGEEVKAEESAATSTDQRNGHGKEGRRVHR